ncbi:MAG: phage portal protein [Clostridia bacterium]
MTKEMDSTGVFRDFLDRFAGKPISPTQVIEENLNLAAEVYTRKLALLSAVGIIARCISKCEIRTFVGGALRKGDEYYLWNVSPNKNQNSSAFLQKLVTTLYTKNEVLVIDVGGQLLIADSYSKKEFATLDNAFEGVTVSGFTFSRPFFAGEVLFFELGEDSVNDLLKNWYAGYGQLAAYAMRKYKLSRGEKGVMTVEAYAPDSDAEKRFNTVMNEQMKIFMKADSAVLPEYTGMKYRSLNESNRAAKETSRDIRAMIDDVFDLTARAIGMPPVLLNGDIAGQDEAVDRLLTICIDPLCDMLQEEINRKRYTKREFLSGNYVQFDTKSIKHVDLLTAATNIDKLIGSGAFCINNILDLCGEPLIDEPWAKKHFITKNYGEIEKETKALDE